ncbi:MAG: hypothetical protein KME42_23620 [Tildeniella nuda ZEHNDER 1965/U140]|jgi:transposase-like protein|nr:hypothetical protein [Tildeniella nuda ZEHNDER 1965/U140]
MKCPRCESLQISKNGHHRGKQNYICKQCGRQFIETYSLRGYSNDAKKICLKMRANGMGYRAIERETGISHNTVINWVRAANGALVDEAEAEENQAIAPVPDTLNQQQALVMQKKKKWLNVKSFDALTTQPIQTCKSGSVY